MSSQGARHMLVPCLISGVYKNYPDTELVKKIGQIYQESNYQFGYEVTTPIMELFGDNWRDINIQVGKFNSYCICTDLGAYFRYLRNSFVNNINTVYGTHYCKMAYENYSYVILVEIQNLLFMWFKIGHVYLVGILAFIVMIRWWIVKKIIPWFYLGVAGIIFVIMLSVYVGTYAEYMRSTSYVLPFAYFGMALLLKDFYEILKRETKILEDDS